MSFSVEDGDEWLKVRITSGKILLEMQAGANGGYRLILLDADAEARLLALLLERREVIKAKATP